MHPVFVARSKTAQPIWFVTPATFAKVIAELDKRARAYREGRGLRAQARPAPDPAVGERHRRRAVRTGEQQGRPQRIPARPAARRAAGRHLSLRQRAARCAACGAWPSRSAPIASRATARRRTRRCGWCCPTASTATISRRIAEGVTLARDLINTPANDMGPAELEAAARALAKQHGAKVRSHRRRRPAEAELSADPRRRPRRRPRRARRG